MADQVRFDRHSVERDGGNPPFADIAGHSNTPPRREVDVSPGKLDLRGRSFGPQPLQCSQGMPFDARRIEGHRHIDPHVTPPAAAIANALQPLLIVPFRLIMCNREDGRNAGFRAALAREPRHGPTIW